LSRLQRALAVVDPLAAHIAFLEQGLVALDVAAGALEVGRGLLLAGVETGRIDRRDHLARPHAVAGLDVHAGQHPGDAERQGHLATAFQRTRPRHGSGGVGRGDSDGLDRRGLDGRFGRLGLAAARRQQGQGGGENERSPEALERERGGAPHRLGSKSISDKLSVID
jgi:hypothetical protein